MIKLIFGKVPRVTGTRNIAIILSRIERINLMSQVSHIDVSRSIDAGPKFFNTLTNYIIDSTQNPY